MAYPAARRGVRDLAVRGLRVLGRSDWSSSKRRIEPPCLLQQLPHARFDGHGQDVAGGDVRVHDFLEGSLTAHARGSQSARPGRGARTNTRTSERTERRRSCRSALTAGSPRCLRTVVRAGIAGLFIDRARAPLRHSPRPPGGKRQAADLMVERILGTVGGSLIIDKHERTEAIVRLDPTRGRRLETPTPGWNGTRPPPATIGPFVRSRRRKLLGSVARAEGRGASGPVASEEHGERHLQRAIREHSCTGGTRP
jgi:hypothetical protein